SAPPRSCATCPSGSECRSMRAHCRRRGSSGYHRRPRPAAAAPHLPPARVPPSSPLLPPSVCLPQIIKHFVKSRGGRTPSATLYFVPIHLPFAALHSAAFTSAPVPP